MINDQLMKSPVPHRVFFFGSQWPSSCKMLSLNSAKAGLMTFRALDGMKQGTGLAENQFFFGL